MNLIDNTWSKLRDFRYAMHKAAIALIASRTAAASTHSSLLKNAGRTVPGACVADSWNLPPWCWPNDQLHKGVRKNFPPPDLPAHRKSEAIGPVLGIVRRVIAGWLAADAGIARSIARTGAVTLIQRFGSALNLNVHFHMLRRWQQRLTNGAPPSRAARRSAAATRGGDVRRGDGDGRGTPPLRANRLALLGGLRALFLLVADISLLPSTQ